VNIDMMTNHNNKIEKLISELCPNGVEFLELGKLASIETGTQLNKTAMAEVGNYPVLNGGINPSGFYHEYNTKENTIAISQGGASAGYVNFVTTKFWAGAHCFVIKPTIDEINNRFLYFILKNSQEKLQNAKLGAGIPGLNKRELQNFKILIPPLAIQEEIVRILDSFTELEAELEAELEERKKQCEYYRDEMLSFGDEIEWNKLGEIVRIKNGKDWKKLREGEIPVYGTGGIMGYVNKSVYNKPTVLIPRKGSITNLYYLEEPFWNVDTIYYTEINEEKIIPKFLFYYLKTLDLMKLDTGSGRPSLTQAILNQIKIPVPPLKEQERIVSILDKFDALVNGVDSRSGSGMTGSLPAEIKARRQQYEYYRGKLLDFKPLSGRIRPL
jgi:type I restriction enzyme S subunit